MQKQRRQRTKPTPTPAALPPIPTDTREGIVAHTVDTLLREVNGEFDAAEADEISKLFDLPVLFVRQAIYNDTYSDEETVVEYIAWRQRIAAGKAVA